MKFVSSVLTILVVALLSDASNAEQRRHLRVADNSDNNGSKNEGIVDSIDANTMNRIKQRYLMTLHGGRSRVNRSRDIRDRLGQPTRASHVSNDESSNEGSPSIEEPVQVEQSEPEEMSLSMSMSMSMSMRM